MSFMQAKFLTSLSLNFGVFFTLFVNKNKTYWIKSYLEQLVYTCEKTFRKLVGNRYVFKDWVAHHYPGYHFLALVPRVKHNQVFP